ncbi:MAG: hypothetical protein HY903_06040 [Deltaproteobacteria bacterium]|nr:hypothetical protein [Deltaproteobacteria bacterium]
MSRSPVASPRSAVAGHIVLALLVSAVAASAAAANPYGQGKIRLTLQLGSTHYLEGRYIVAGAGFGYFVIDGLELGLEGDYWIGGAPAVAQLSPGVRYVLFFVPAVQPYAGAFYRHRFIGHAADQDTAGARAGALTSIGPGYVGLGLVYERLLSRCAATCDAVYPELAVALTF